MEIRKLISKFRGINTAKIEETTENSSTINHANKIKNWYEEHYDNIVAQRNLLFVLLGTLLFLSIISVGVVVYVINAKRFDPFVIQIDDTTGMAKIVNPVSQNLLNGNDALAQYFIKKYVIARETYNPVDFNTEAKKIIRLLSSSSLYWEYNGYFKNQEVDPTIKYGQKNSTFLLVKSWSKLANTKYIMRFSINETAGAQKVFHKIAVIEFQYVPMELAPGDEDINPVGFQITGYRADDDSS